MKCTETRTVPGTNAMRRRYECKACQARITTVEQEVESVACRPVQFIENNDVEQMKTELLRVVAEAIAGFKGTRRRQDHK